MEEEGISKLRDDIIDVIIDHQYDLSDGFEYYSSNAIEEIEKEINMILRKAIGGTKK